MDLETLKGLDMSMKNVCFMKVLKKAESGEDFDEAIFVTQEANICAVIYQERSGNQVLLTAGYLGTRDKLIEYAVHLAKDKDCLSEAYCKGIEIYRG